MEYSDIKRLLDDMGNSKVDSLDIEFPDGTKIKMKKNEAKIIEAIEPRPMPVVKEVSLPSPKDAPYVKIGDKVKKGDVLCVVEAMKLMNEIESEFDGEIVEICVKNEEMVEYGTTLFKIK